jgi:hypothetical protein
MSIWNWLLSKLVKEPTTTTPEDAKAEDVSENEEKVVAAEEPVVSPKVEPEAPKKAEPKVTKAKAKAKAPKEAEPKVVKDEKSAALTEAELLEGYKKAMQLKKDGKVLAAEKLLMKSCEPASVYKGHYKELFKIWRQYNRDDLKVKKYRKVLDRVLKMIKLDDEMIAEMLRYWGTEQNKNLPEDYFDADRNLLISDVKALRVAAEALQENKNVELADGIMEKFSKK